MIQRISGIEVELTRVGDGFEVRHLGELLGTVKRVERFGETMWQAEGSKRLRSMMPRAVEELLIRADLLDGMGW